MASGSVSFRDRSKIYLVGYPTHQITGSKLPSRGQVLKSLFYNMREVGLDLKESAKLTLSEVSLFWSKARIPAQQPKHAISKIEKLYDEWRNLQKSSARKSKTQEEKEQLFKSKLDDLFDIASSDAISTMKNSEDIQFLTLQRQKGRPGCMGGVDLKFTQAEERRATRNAIREQYYQAKRAVVSNEEIELPLSSESEDEDQPMDTAADINIPHTESSENPITQSSFTCDSSSPVSKRARQNEGLEVITEKVAVLLDRCNISDRNAMRIIFATAEALGVSTSTIALSRSTIRNRRLTFRMKRASIIKENFKNKSFQGSVIHWDGKMLPNLLNKGNVDRLAVLVSNGEEEQLLGVPPLENSTGDSQSEAVAELVYDWGLSDDIIGMCFDTTASNTGRIKGACTLLEKQLGKDLLYLACRHHILEVILKAVFDTKMGCTTGPQPEIFKRFQMSWSKIDQSKYKVGIEDSIVQNNTRECAEEITSFLFSQIQENLPRDDYLEFANLCLIFLGKMSPDKIKFRSPGAFSHARWMAKAIYALKIFIFREEFPLTEKELESLRDICVFVVSLYVRMWFTASNAITAPNSDFNFVRNLLEYQKIDHIISEKALQKFLSHLWYLNPEQVCLSLFDENVSSEMKKKMAEKIIKNKNQSNEIGQRIVRANVTDVNKIFQNGDLSYFITDQSINFFEKLDISPEFLHQNPCSWLEDEEYLKGFGLVTHLKVINDTAERGVKLIQDFNTNITYNEEQKQYLLQVVAECRKRYPDVSKTTLSKNL